MNDSEMNSGQSQPWSATDVWAPGWYADPWQAGRERRWTGNAWTTETRGALGPNIAGLGGAPPAPAAPPPGELAPEEVAATAASATRWNTRRVLTVVGALALVALILGFTVTYVAADTKSNASSNTPADNTLPSQPTPNTTPSFGSLPSGLTPTPNNGTPGGSDGSGNPSSGSSGSSSNPSNGSSGGSANGSANGSTDPNSAVLRSLVVQQADVKQPNTVQVMQGGDSVDGAATLDLCNGNYASESLRTARLQVVVDDSNGEQAFSTEAVLYQDANAAKQALSELRSVVASCPSSPVVSPVGEETVATTFHAQPDTSWPQVSGITRQAYAFTMTDTTGATSDGVAVYMQRGRALLALYFQNPSSPQPSITGSTSMQGITAAFAQRLASVPASSIGA